MSTVNTHVWVTKDGYPTLLRPGDTVPDGVTVTNPAVLDESDADEAEGNEQTDPVETANEKGDLVPEADSDADESDADEAPEAPADEAPAPRKRAARKAAASE